MSLLGSDMLYKIHVRLCEVFQTEAPFGNVSVCLVGDLLQLPPVKANYIFEEPLRNSHYKAFHSASKLFESFTPHVFVQNHRQGKSRDFAETLNNIRVGELTEADQNLLMSRLTNEEFLEDDAMHIFYTNKEVNEHNKKMLDKIQEPEICIKAKKFAPKGYEPKESPNGTVDSTQFMNVLKIKKGARCVLNFNVDVIDGLVNGSSGTIIGIEMRLGKPYCVMVQFDDPSCGKELRAKFPQLAKKYEDKNGTPIFMQDLEYQVMSRKGYGHATKSKVRQFPLKLFYSSTAHKMQGQTVMAGAIVIIHWNKRMTDGMAYVMLGRSERIDDVFIAGDFDINGIKCSKLALDESNRLLQIHLNRNMDQDEFRSKNWKISFLNVMSLNAHKNDVEKDNYLLDSDIFGLGETWLEIGSEVQLSNFAGFFANFGRGKGVAAYSKMALVEDPSMVSSDSCSAIKLRVSEFDIIFLYVSSSCHLENLITFLKDWINPERGTIIMGDFNIPFKEDSRIDKEMKEMGFLQLVSSVTHDKGNLIDHIYVNEQITSNGCSIEKNASYYSDHDIVTIFVDKKM